MTIYTFILSNNFFFLFAHPSGSLIKGKHVHCVCMQLTFFLTRAFVKYDHYLRAFDNQTHFINHDLYLHSFLPVLIFFLVCICFQHCFITVIIIDSCAFVFFLLSKVHPGQRELFFIHFLTSFTA